MESGLVTKRELAPGVIVADTLTGFEGEIV
jgi:hypothetical protein